MTSVEKQLSNNAQHIAKTEHRVASDEQQIANNAQHIAKTERRVSSDEQQISNNAQHIAKTERRVASDEQQIANNAQHISNTERRVASDEQQISNNTQHITKTEQRLNSDEQQIQRNTQDIKDLRKDFERMADDINGAYAEAAALNGLTEPHNVGSIMVSVGLGHHGNADALAFGAGERFNEHLTAKVGAAYNSATSAITTYVGMGYEF
ncbi:YadA C-terminal domain-containing protein [Vibrio thalassae]|uniref:YadA C-terminal domain-containing protein n=1 Tax=Vibrio thalassae TaxID=1243014 RepID=UPI0013051E63|nr:YadA C-terminal domain-containing protein [Vibrio thalassae]